MNENTYVCPASPGLFGKGRLFQIVGTVIYAVLMVMRQYWAGIIIFGIVILSEIPIILERNVSAPKALAIDDMNVCLKKSKDGEILQTVCRDHLHLKLYKTTFTCEWMWAFSEQEIEALDKRQVLRLIDQKRAFCFPYSAFIYQDYPEIFGSEGGVVSAMDRR